MSAYNRDSRISQLLPYGLKSDPYSSHAVILSRLGEGRGRSLLDVGAADGFLAELLTRQGWTVTALERDPEQAARAQGKCKEVVVADLNAAAPHVGGPFDAIVYGDVVEHLADPLRVLVNLNRTLAPAGVVVISVPNIAHRWVRLMLLLGRFDYAERGTLDRTHLRFFTRCTFREFVGRAGLEARELVVAPVPLPLVVPDRWPRERRANGRGEAPGEGRGGDAGVQRRPHPALDVRRSAEGDREPRDPGGRRLNLSASLYEILRILSLTMFERTSLNQLLTLSAPESMIVALANQLKLFE